MSSRSLSGRRVVVVGASAGIGRAFATRAVRDGAQVVLGARRADRLEQVVAEAGGGSRVVCDIRTETGRQRLADAARADLGHVDLLLCAVGVAPLRLLEDASTDDWTATFETNVIGTQQVVRACLPLLQPGAMVAVLSSESVGQGRPALGIYSASKAALDQLVETWRAERPDIRFTQVVVGSTIDTEFGLAFSPDLLTWALQDWQARGLLPENYLLSDDVAEALAGTLATALSLPDVGLDAITLRPASRVAGTPDPPAVDRTTASSLTTYPGEPDPNITSGADR